MQAYEYHPFDHTTLQSCSLNKTHGDVRRLDQTMLLYGNARGWYRFRAKNVKPSTFFPPHKINKNEFRVERIQLLLQRQADYTQMHNSPDPPQLRPAQIQSRMSQLFRACPTAVGHTKIPSACAAACSNWQGVSSSWW